MEPITIAMALTGLLALVHVRRQLIRQRRLTVLKARFESHRKAPPAARADLPLIEWTEV